MRGWKTSASCGGAVGQRDGPEHSLSCQDWAAAKAAYRFFSNSRVSEEQILAGHFLSTRERIACGEELFLVVHDTTEFSYKREDMAAVGLVSKGSVRKDAEGRCTSPPAGLTCTPVWR